MAWTEAVYQAETNGEGNERHDDNVEGLPGSGHADSPVQLKPRYENFIGGHWVPPVQGRYMQDLSPANARKFTEVPRSTKEDIELALDAAHASREAWGVTSLTERARVLNRIADVIEEHTEISRSPRPGTTASRCAKP